LYDPAVASLGAWLATIARNRAIDRLRARGRRLAALPLSSITAYGDENAPMDDRILDSGVLLAGAQREPEPAAAGEAAWLRDTLAQAVATLPSLERQVIELAYARELTQAEIASRLGWPLGTVKTRTRRALASLNEALSEALGPDQGVVDATMVTAPSASSSGRRSAAAGEPASPACVCA
jgi:RNA polymerase sigma-70 factor (ECF subfamily)